MDSSHNDQIRCIAGFTAAGALLAYLGGARFKDVLLFGGIGMLGGFTVAEFQADPGKGPVESLILKTQECFREAQNALWEMAKEFDDDLQSHIGWRLDQTLEYTAVLCLSFWVWYSLLGVEFEDGLMWSLGTTGFWGVGRTLVFTDPPPPPPSEKHPEKDITTPPERKSYVPPSPVPPVPLTPEEEQAFPNLLEECRANLETIRSSLSGIRNLGNDCYMNALIQWLLTTNLLDEILKTNPEDLEEVEAQRFYFCFVRTLLQMGQLNGFVNVAPNSNWARSSLGFSAGTQQDAGEALFQVGNFFGLGDQAKEHQWWQLELKRRLEIGADSTRLRLLPERDAEGREWDVSPVDQEGFRIDARMPDWMMTMEPPEQLDCGQISLQGLIDHQFSPWPHDEDVRFSLEGNVYESRMVDEQTLVKRSQPDLYCMFKRFLYEPNRKLQYKIQTEDFKVNIDGKPYEVKSFIVHHGSSMGGGHYYTYAKEGETWRRYNDSSVREAALEEVCGEFAKAYVVHFAQQPNLDDVE